MRVLSLAMLSIVVTVLAQNHSDSPSIQAVVDELGSVSALRLAGNASERVLVDAASGLPVEVASAETLVVDGRLVDRATRQTVKTSVESIDVVAGVLVDRSTGNPVQTAQSVHTVTLPDGPVALLEYRLSDLQDIQTVMISSGADLDDPEELEMHQIVGVRRMVGGAGERALTLSTAAGEEILCAAIVVQCSPSCAIPILCLSWSAQDHPSSKSHQAVCDGYDT